MGIILRLDRVMADRKMSLNELSERVGVANVNLSKLKNGHVSAIRFSTLEAICDVLDCQPGDILEYKREENKYSKRLECVFAFKPFLYPPGSSLTPFRFPFCECERWRGSWFAGLRPPGSVPCCQRAHR